MSLHAGKSGAIKAVATGGTAAAVGEVKSYTLNTTAETVEANKIGTDWAQSLAGLRSWSVDLEAYYDPADAAQADLVEGAEVDLELYPASETSGEESLTGTGFVTSVSVTVANDIVVGYAVSVTGSGALTRGVVT